MAQLNLRLLGDFEARLGSGPPLRLRARKTQALLAYLASPPGQTHSRDKLASLLWGDSSQSQARSRLRGSLFMLRRTLAPANPPCLALDSEAVALHVAAVDVDVVDFGRLVQVHNPENLAKAAELYRGDLLEGFAFRGALFEEWLMAERERLRELAVDTLAKLLVHQRSAGVFEVAVQTGLRLVALDPLQESVHRTLMRLYAELGRKSAALRQYQICVRVLQRELGMEPEAETKRLYQELVRRQPQGFAKAPDRAQLHNRHGSEQPFPDLLTKYTPLIGREAERAQLRQVLEDAARSQGSVVTVVGEAGIGKTSVLGALARDAIALGARVLVGRCYESASILPFGPWVDAFRSGQSLEDEGLLDELRPVWRSELARLLPEADTAGLPAPSDNQLRLFEGVAQLVERLAARWALVLMLEDIHWADEMSLRLLAFISRRIAGWRVLVLTTARKPELVDASMARRTLEELGRELHATSLELAPLSRPDTDLLVRSLSRVGADAAALMRLEEQVWTVSEGNPFVAVETMRALHEGSIVEGSTTLPLPKRVRDLIADRLGRLSDRGRQLAPVAAVIGREFDFALLQRAAGCDEAGAAEGVEELVRRGVLEGTDDRFDFTHDRIRALIIAELLLPQRKLLHRQIGAALEALHADDLETHSFALGTHYRAGEVWDKAVHYLRQAGVRALARSANREAVTCFEEAVTALGHLPETPETLEQGIDLRFDLRTSLFPLGEFERIFGCLSEAEGLAKALDDQRRLGQLSVYLCHNLHMTGDDTKAYGFGQRARALAESLGDVQLLVTGTLYLSAACAGIGDYRQAEEILLKVLQLLHGDLSRERLRLAGFPAVAASYHLTRIFADQGKFEEGIVHGREGIRIAEGLDHPYSLCFMCAALASLYVARGELSRAVPLLERGVGLGREWNLIIHSLENTGILGYAYALSGRNAEGIPLLEDALSATETMGAGYYSFFLVYLGEAYALADRLEDAREFAGRALTLARERDQRPREAWALWLLGEVIARRHPSEYAEGHYHDALALAESLGMRPLVAHCHLGLGKLYRRTGKREQAQEHLTTALTMYREMGMTYWLENAANEREQLR